MMYVPKVWHSSTVILLLCDKCRHVAGTRLSVVDVWRIKRTPKKFQSYSHTAVCWCYHRRRKVQLISIFQPQLRQLHVDYIMVLMELKNSNFLLCLLHDGVLYYSSLNSLHWIRCYQFYRALFLQNIFMCDNQMGSMIVWLLVWMDDDTDHDAYLMDRLMAKYQRQCMFLNQMFLTNLWEIAHLFDVLRRASLCWMTRDFLIRC